MGEGRVLVDSWVVKKARPDDGQICGVGFGFVMWHEAQEGTVARTVLPSLGAGPERVSD